MNQIRSVPFPNRKRSILRERLARSVQFQYQNEIMSGIVSKLTGANIRYKPINVVTPISSASLFCSVIKNYAIRNNHFSNNHMRRIEGILHPKNKLWNTTQWPEPRRTAIFNTIEQLTARRKMDLVKKNYLKNMCVLFPSSERYKKMYLQTDSHTQIQLSKQLSLMNILHAAQFKTDIVCSSSFPKTASNSDKSTTSMGSSGTFVNDIVQKSNAQVSHLCNTLMSGDIGDNSNKGNNGSGRTLIGVAVRLKGVRVGGALSTTFQKSVGRTSTNSIFGKKGKGGLVYEKASCQIRTTQGVVGLKLTIVYARQQDLLSPKYQVSQYLQPIRPQVSASNFIFSLPAYKSTNGIEQYQRIAEDISLSELMSSFKPTTNKINSI